MAGARKYPEELLERGTCVRVRPPDSPTSLVTWASILSAWISLEWTRFDMIHSRPATRFPVHLAPPHPAEGSGSRRRGRLSERREISPGVGLLEGMLVIDGVGSVDLGGTVASDKSL